MKLKTIEIKKCNNDKHLPIGKCTDEDLSADKAWDFVRSNPISKE